MIGTSLFVVLLLFLSLATIQYKLPEADANNTGASQGVAVPATETSVHNIKNSNTSLSYQNPDFVRSQVAWKWLRRFWRMRNAK